MNVDDLAQEIRRVDGNHSLGAGALAEALMPYLRARSSAPEAREEEAVGWKYEVFGPEGRSRSVRGVIGPKPNVAAPVGGYVLYDALFTHPAAPSADKLRIATDALDRIATVDMGGGFLGALACRQVANQALAALKAEGKT